MKRVQEKIVDSEKCEYAQLQLKAPQCERKTLQNRFVVLNITRVLEIVIFFHFKAPHYHSNCIHIVHISN